jgi:TPP-dependent pyruvate/acetoin dehydrogenase alpha subunit
MLPDVDQPRLIELLRKSLLIRRFEEALIRFARVHSVGHFHVYIGQEITGVAALSLLGAGDLCFTTHRNHGHLLARGAEPGRMLAEILGRETGYCGGRGGTLHIASLQHGFPTTSSAVGGCTPLATGAAFAMRRLGLDRVSVCLFGDGALEEGSWHESANIAALERLPVIFLCENNSLQALGQRAGEYPSSTLATSELTDLAKVFKIPAIAVDGVDANAIHCAMQDGIARARAGNGPTFIEARTVRWPGNRPLWPELLTGETNLAMAWSKDAVPAEFQSWYLAEDGLLRLVRELLAAGQTDSEKVLELDAAARKQMQEAEAFALQSEYPSPESALECVYAHGAE